MKIVGPDGRITGVWVRQVAEPAGWGWKRTEVEIIATDGTSWVTVVLPDGTKRAAPAEEVTVNLW